MKHIGKISVITIFILFISINISATDEYSKTTINGKECYIYYVQPGEGFYSIGKKFGVTRDDVVKFNPETKNGLNKGQKIFIPTLDQSNKNDEQNSVTKKTHIVKAGESLYGISKRYNVSINELKTLNNLNSNSIRVGQILIVGGSSVQKKENKPEKSEIVEPKTTPQEDTAKSDEKIQEENFEPDDNKVVINGETYNTEKYVVKKKETLYSISQKFNTTVDAIIACNPNIKKLSKDDVLNIPMTKEVTNVVNEYKTENNSLILESFKKIVDSNAINIAVIFPFKSNLQGAQSPYADYYKGLLLALDSIKSNGLIANVYVFDTYGNIETIQEIINKPEMKNMDIIFCSDKQEDIALLGNFAKANGIYLVNSFSVKNNEYENNPYIIQGHIPSTIFFSSASKHIAEHIADKEIIFLYDNQEPNDKQDFINAISTALRLKGKEYKKFSFNEITDYEILLQSIENNSDVVFIASSSSKSGVAKTCAIATRIKDSNPTLSISVIGYPEWQTYIKDYLDTFHMLNTSIFTRFYSETTKSEWKDFNKNFRYWYGNEKTSIIPSPNILGFDTGMYLINGMLRHKDNFEQYLETIESQSIQTDFSFRRLYNECGLVNTNLYFITFTSDYKIVKEKIN